MKTFNAIRKKMLLLIASFFMLASTSIAGDTDIAFKSGEKISYDTYYNWGFIWIHAGNVQFTAKETIYRKEPSYMFSVIGHSLNSFDDYFMVRDSFTTIVNKETFLPKYHKRIAREDKYWAQDIYWFKEPKNNQVTIITECKRKNGKRNVDTLTVKPAVTDLVTAFYNARNIDYSKMKINEKIPLSIVFADDDKQFDLWLSYQGKEEIKLRNGKKYKCIKLKPLLIEGAVFTDDDAMSIWITDDLNRIPILVESKIRVGTVKLMLKDVSNLKYPMSSLTK